MEGTRRVCTWLLGSKNIMNKLALVHLAKPPIAFASNRNRLALKIENLMTKIKGSNLLGYWLNQTNHQKNFEVVWHSHPLKVFWKGKNRKETAFNFLSFLIKVRNHFPNIIATKLREIPVHVPNLTWLFGGSRTSCTFGFRAFKRDIQSEIFKVLLTTLQIFEGYLYMHRQPWMMKHF